MALAFAAAIFGPRVAADTGSARLEVIGRLEADGQGFILTADSVRWTLDLSGDAKLADTARTLAGRVAEAAGVPRPGAANVVAVERLRERSGAGAHHSRITLQGPLRAGAMAIGGETTGITVSAAGTAWELVLEPRRRARAEALHGELVRVEGRLVIRSGIELRRRQLVEVRSLARARPQPAR